MNRPLISVVIPVYNAEKYLNACVDSILAQNFDSYEIILINDGSSDDSSAICDYYTAKYNNISAYHNVNQGVSVTRNHGVEVATGEYVLFVDSDDVLTEGLFECIAQDVKCNDPDIVVFEIMWKFHNGSQHHIPLDKNFASTNSQLSDTIDNLIRRGVFYSPVNKLYRRSIIVNNSIEFDGKYSRGEDLLFNTWIFPFANSISVVPMIGYIYYIRQGDSLSKKYALDYCDQLLFCHNELLTLYKKIHKSDTSHLAALYEYNMKQFLYWLVDQSSESKTVKRTKFKKATTSKVFKSQISRSANLLNLCLRLRSFVLFQLFVKVRQIKTKNKQ